MLLAWAVSCESYELHEDGTVDIFGAGFDTFYVDGLPAKLELMVLVRLLLQEDEKTEIELQVLGPEPLSSLASIVYPIEAEPGQNHRPGYLVAQTEGLEVSFLAETEGPYSLEIYADKGPNVTEERRRSIFFNVRDGLPE